jgi:hypothetical protein
MAGGKEFEHVALALCEAVRVGAGVFAARVWIAAAQVGEALLGAAGRLDYFFLLGMITMTINVKMLKNRPRIPQPNGLRPFTPAITAHTIAAIMLPIATNIPLIPFKINPAATGLSCAANINPCSMPISSVLCLMTCSGTPPGRGPTSKTPRAFRAR